MTLKFEIGQKLPLILQAEAAECGLACLTMVARYHGHDVDLPSLRQRYSTSLKGATLARIIEMAASLGLTPRPLRAELTDLSKLDVPCLLHWNLNHFVVLKRVLKDHIVIHDPGAGVRKLSLTEASKHFTGIVLELKSSPQFKPIVERQSISLRTLTGRIVGFRTALIQIFALAFGLEVFTIIGPFFLQWVMDQVLVSGDRDLLTVLGVGFLMVMIFQVAIFAVRSWVVVWLGATLNVQWVSNAFWHLLRLPLDYFEKRHIGDIVSRFGSINSIQKTLTTDFVSAILDGLMAAITLAAVFVYSKTLGVIAAASVFLYGLIRWFTYEPLRRAQEEQIVYTGRQQSEFLESIRGVQALKLFNQQDQRSARYGNAAVETTNRDVRLQRLAIVFKSFDQLVFGTQRILLVWIGAWYVLDKTFTAGMLIAVLSYSELLMSRGIALVDKGIEFRMLRLHAERVADIVLTETETDVGAHSDITQTSASLEIDGLSFRYAEGEPWVLKDCSMKVSEGESVAIVGPSGCGKTTLAKVILGLLRQTSGTVQFGGFDIRKIGLSNYRNTVSAVMQDDQLFAGTIAENISFFDAHASREEVESAAKSASIHEDIISMPMSYSTLVGDMGSTLSGGQKQRILLARSLYRKPMLLVLDEATSHLDLERERLVNDAIRHLSITRIIIAHRPETIASVDRVFLMFNGSLHEQSPLPSDRLHEVEIKRHVVHHLPI